MYILKVKYSNGHFPFMCEGTSIDELRNLYKDMYSAERDVDSGIIYELGETVAEVKGDLPLCVEI